jgi:hypothetical protein
VNGLTGSRRVARPVRLSLAKKLGCDLDGAWWPYSASVAQELPELIWSLHKPLGEIADICINWSVTEGSLDFETLTKGTPSPASAKYRRLRLMLIDGRIGCAKLLVVPPMTSPSLGALVMRCAAAKPILRSERDGRTFEIADLVIRTARVESANWTARLRKAAASKSDG